MATASVVHENQDFSITNLLVHVMRPGCSRWLPVGAAAPALVRRLGRGCTIASERCTATSMTLCDIPRAYLDGAHPGKLGRPLTSIEKTCWEWCDDLTAVTG